LAKGGILNIDKGFFIHQISVVNFLILIPCDQHANWRVAVLQKKTAHVLLVLAISSFFGG